MNRVNFKENFGIVFGISVMVAMIVAWGWFIWSLCGNGFNVWQKILWVLGSYLVVGCLCKICSIPGVGAVPVKVVYWEERK